MVEQPGPRPLAHLEADRVADDGAHHHHHDHGLQVHLVEAGQTPADDHRRLTGDEEPDEQSRLGKDQRTPPGIGGRPVEVVQPAHEPTGELRSDDAATSRIMARPMTAERLTEKG